jgi:hypothetical protein
MRKCLPDIVIDDVAAPPSKRQRLNAPHAGGVATESACNASERESLSRTTTPLSSTCATAKEICENTLVCYGMVRRMSSQLCRLCLHSLDIRLDSEHSPPLRRLSCLNPTPDPLPTPSHTLLWYRRYTSRTARRLWGRVATEAGSR